MVNNINEVLIAGFAKLPSTTAAEAVYNVLEVAVIFDKRDSIITKAEATMVTDIAKDYLSEFLVGYDMSKGMDELAEVFNENYFGNAKKAIFAALKDLFSRYQEYMDGDIVR